MPYKDKENKREYSKRYRLANKEHLDHNKKVWYEEHREQVKETDRVWRQTHPQQYLYVRAKCSARYRNLEFNLCVEDIIIPEVCPYLGIKLLIMPTMAQRDAAASLDRIDNTKGYIKGNIEVISDLANRMKRTATKEQLLKFAELIRNRYSDERPAR